MKQADATRLAIRDNASMTDRPPRSSFLRGGDTLRLAGTLAVLPAVWLTGAPTAARVAVSAALVANLFLSGVAERYHDAHPGFPVVWVAGTLGATTAFVFSYLDDDMRVVGLFGYLVLIGYVLGLAARRRDALLIATGCGALALVREWGVDAGERFPPIVFVVYFACAYLLVFFIDGLRRDAARAARTLERVQEAMRSVTTSPELDETLDSLVVAAAAAVGASGAGILLREDDHLVLAAPSSMRGDWPDDEVARFTRVELTDSARSPLAHACLRGETVVVPDLAAERRFPEWSRAFAVLLGQLRTNAVVIVPLRAGGDVVGAMQTIFAGSIPDRDDTVRVLEGYAEQAALVIVRAQAYERERHVRERLAEADRLKTEFLALVSHELRTPLTAVKGFVETVLTQWDRLPDERRRDLLHRASTNADDLARLIDQLLVYARLEHEELALDRVPTPVAPEIADVVERLEPVLGDRRVTIDVPARLVALADPTGFRHVVENLLSNAAKFSPRGSRIEVTAHAEGGAVVVAVADEGPGVPPGEQERIFERFYQRAEHRAARRGTGLGLAIARRYAEAMGGRLRVASGPGAGATFVLTVPAPGGPGAQGGGLTAGVPADKLDQPV